MSNESASNNISVSVDCIFTVRLECQTGSTGYSWALAHMPDSVNLLDISFEASSSHILGCKETQVYTFVALTKDDNYIEFNLLRPWDPQNIADTRKYALVIEEQDQTANDLQQTAGCNKFSSFGECDSNQVNALYMGQPVMKYMGPPVMKYMGPPVMKYMGPPVIKYMAPVDSKESEDK